LIKPLSVNAALLSFVKMKPRICGV